MKKIVFIIISFLISISCVKALDLNSKNVYVYNLTEDKIMYEKDAYEEIKVASMTKIMTAIIVIENNKDLDKKLTILDEDLRDMYEYTTTGFQDQDEVTIKELLYGILLKSGSDAVNAAVRITTDTEEDFIGLMNQKVKELGLKNTYFSNPIGKDDDNYSSVYDIAKIMEYCLKNETFKEIISTDMHYIERLDLQINGPFYKMDTQYDVDLSLIAGGKSGYTNLARFSLVSYGEKDGITYIVVTAYADKYRDLLLDNSNIYNYFFSNYSYKDYNVNFDIEVENAYIQNYNLNINTKLFLENNYNDKLITYKYDGINKINFLNTKGSKLGSISIYYDNELIKEVDAILNENIEYKPKAFFKLGTIITTVIIIVILIILFKLKKINLKKVIKKTKKNIKEKQIKKNNEKIKQFIKEENSLEKKLEILKNTTDINRFFDTLKSVSYTTTDKENFEHDFIDRCFYSTNFKNLESLKELYTKLKLYKKDMCQKTIKYYNKLFKYCIDKYVDKK